MGADAVIDGDKGVYFFSSFGVKHQVTIPTDLLIFYQVDFEKNFFKFVKMKPIEIDWTKPFD